MKKKRLTNKGIKKAILAVRRRAGKRKSSSDAATPDAEKEETTNEQCACDALQLQWMQGPGSVNVISQSNYSISSLNNFSGCKGLGQRM